MVGAPGKDISGNDSDEGKAYLYEISGNTVNRVAIIDASGGENEPGAQFGYSVSLNGNRIVVGAPGKDISGNDSDEGKAYLYEISGNTVNRVAIIDASGGENEPGAGFGASVSLNGNRIVVGAPGKDISGNDSDEGKAYLYEISGNTVNRVAIIDASGGENDPLAYFGTSVSLNGNYIVVGSPEKDISGVGSDAGKAYLYEISGNTVNRVAIIDASGGENEPLARFGYSVSLNGNRIVVGSPRKDISGVGFDAGKAYLYEISGNTVNRVAIIDASGGENEEDANFGTSVSLNDSNYVAIGAPYKDIKSRFGAGKMYVYA